MLNTKVYCSAVSFCGNIPYFQKGNTKNSLINSNTKQVNQNNLELPNFYYYPVSFKKNNETTPVNKIMQNLSHNDCDPKILYDIGKLNETDSQEFIDKYCEHTGFPNLNKINKNMKNHVIDVMEKSAKEVGTEVLWCGYHRECSTSHNLSLPGSDIDATNAIIVGNQNVINKFNNRLWNNYDPTLVSIRKENEFPDVYSIEQIYEWTQVIDDIVQNSEMGNKTQLYAENLKENKNFNKALEFNIDIAQEIDNISSSIDKDEPKYSHSTSYFQKKAPSLAQLMTYPGRTPKNITQSISAVLETLRSGNVLIEKDLTPEQNKKMQEIKNSALYKYGNLCMNEAGFGIKPKLTARKKYINEEHFNSLNIDDKKTLISTIIYKSYPKWSKNKIMDLHKADEMFDNGANIDLERIEAFYKTVDL